jgi:hypothetical protein
MLMPLGQKSGDLRLILEVMKIGHRDGSYQVCISILPSEMPFATEQGARGIHWPRFWSRETGKRAKSLSAFGEMNLPKSSFVVPQLRKDFVKSKLQGKHSG